MSLPFQPRSTNENWNRGWIGIREHRVATKFSVSICSLAVCSFACLRYDYYYSSLSVKNAINIGCIVYNNLQVVLGCGPTMPSFIHYADILPPGIGNLFQRITFATTHAVFVVDVVCAYLAEGKKAMGNVNVNHRIHNFAIIQIEKVKLRN